MLGTEKLVKIFAPGNAEVREVWTQLNSGEFNNLYWPPLSRGLGYSRRYQIF
jgi:hypothetical protein